MVAVVSILLENAVNGACEAIARVKYDLSCADTQALHGSPLVRDQSAKTKAWAYIWLEAVNERYVKSVVQAILSEINASGVPRNKLRKTLFAVVFAPEFQSLKTARALRSISQRSAMFSTLEDVTQVTMNVNEAVLDGRTIGAEHFECIWRLFGFRPPSLPGSHHALALRDLAEGRNDVAHGHVDPVAFGRRKAAPDVIRLASLLEEVLMHLFFAADDYITNTHYRLP